MILFSPIGATDPLRDFRDGALLHIVRHYKERGLWKVVLFYTKDMGETAKNFDPYKRSIKKVAPEMEIEEIFTNITQPQLFDTFIDIFPKIIYEIHEEYPREKILLNLSSGTPQMKSLLSLIAVENNYTIPVQVNSPREAANRNLPHISNEEDFLIMFWDMADDAPDAPNRCLEPPLRVIRKYSDKSKILSLSLRYDYDAALTIAEKNEDIPVIVTKLLTHATYRRKLQPKDACEILETYNGEKLCPFEDAKRDLMEYYLTIDVDQKTNNLFGILVKSTPFIYELLLDLILHDNELNIEQCCIHQGSKKFLLKRDLLAEKNPSLTEFFDKVYKPQFRDSQLASINLTNICEFASKNSLDDSKRELYEKIVDIIKLLNKRDVFLLRNDVAHIIIDIDEKKFQHITGLKPKEEEKKSASQKLVEYFFELLCLVYGEDVRLQRGFYDRLNRWLKSELEK